MNVVEEENDFETNLALYRNEITLTIDAFGTISIPEVGTVNCLRGSYAIKIYKRADESSPFVLQRTQNAIGFFSKQGHLFYGVVSSMSGTTATFDSFAFQTVIPTHLLTEATDVKLNNDSRGVTINSTNQSSHPSAVLDVSSDNKGVLIPRVTQANRPTNPADGLIIYQIDGVKGLYVYVGGTGWLRLATE